MGIAIYVHIPFCRQKCSYCDFPSYPLQGPEVEPYLEALEQEISWYREELKTKVSSLFIGGGTPSILNPGQLTRLFKCFSQNLALDSETEITIEANPGTLDLAKLSLLKTLGVNRLSLGVQSFEPAMLKQLGRIHSVEEAELAYNSARQAGFANINLDLMHGLPQQDLNTWQQTLTRAVELGPEHLAVYGLIIEEGTPFGLAWEKGLLSLPEEELRAEMAAWSAEFLAAKGYEHYEISNYAKPGYQCRHNLVYWRNQTYLGFGAGAASYWQGVRRSNDNQVAGYIHKVLSGQSPSGEQEVLGTEVEMSETMFLGLRLLKGVSRRRFKARFKVDLADIYGVQINNLQAKGLLLDDGEYIRLSQPGILLANEVFCEFIL